MDNSNRNLNIGYLYNCYNESSHCDECGNCIPFQQWLRNAEGSQLTLCAHLQRVSKDVQRYVRARGVIQMIRESLKFTEEERKSKAERKNREAIDSDVKATLASLEHGVYNGH